MWSPKAGRVFTMTTSLISSIEKDFIVLDADKKATLEPFNSTLYERLNRHYDGFKGCELIACHNFDQDWPTWEAHPNGDEVVMLLSGKAELVLQLAEGEQSVTLEEAGAFVIVPKNVRHTARISEQAKMLFITPGEGTENVEV